MQRIPEASSARASTICRSSTACRWCCAGAPAGAHDWTPDPALGAVFQALPGASFTVNGVAPPKNSALTTAAAELHVTSNWTAIAKFDGEFGAGAQTYGGTGTLKYSW